MEREFVKSYNKLHSTGISNKRIIERGEGSGKTKDLNNRCNTSNQGYKRRQSRNKVICTLSHKNSLRKKDWSQTAGEVFCFYIIQ